MNIIIRPPKNARWQGGGLLSKREWEWEISEIPEFCQAAERDMDYCLEVWIMPIGIGAL